MVGTIIICLLVLYLFVDFMFVWVIAKSMKETEDRLRRIEIQLYDLHFTSPEKGGFPSGLGKGGVW